MDNNIVTQVVKVELPQIETNQVKILETLGKITRDLQKELEPSSTPLAYVDAQIILDYLTTVNKDDDPNAIPERVKNGSLVPIDWLDNTPVVNGLPVWERLDCEPLDYYKIYKIYREQKYIGTYKKEQIEDDGVQTEQNQNQETEPVETVRHSRSFDNLEKSTGIKRKALYALSMVYHWQLRTNLYDRFREDLLEKERKRLISLMENKHRSAAEKIFGKCMKYLEDVTQDKVRMEKVSPKEMLSWMEMAVRMDRLSLGIPADKPITEQDRQKLTSVVRVQKDESKHLTINIAGKKGKDKDKYLQEMLDILQGADAVPKSIEAKADIMEEVKEENIDTEDGNSDKEQIDSK